MKQENQYMEKSQSEIQQDRILGQKIQAAFDSIPKNWVNQQTFKFFKSLSFRNYILAGNSVANMAQKIPLQGDLDFWVSDYDVYLQVLKQIGQHYQHFSIYPSFVEMYNDDGIIPRINIVYTQLNDDQTIDRFDFDYCRCYWSLETGIKYGRGCLKSIRTKIICQQASSYRITKKRILKAIKYGYVFTASFWTNFWYLIKNRQLKLKKLIQDAGDNQPIPISLSDLDLQKFQMKQITLKVKDIFNCKQTLKQLAQQYKKLSLNPSKNIKLPVLLRLDKSTRSMLQQYVESIVLLNPLANTHYMEIKIGTHFIYCRQRPQNVDETERRREEQSEKQEKQEVQSQQESEDQQQQQQEQQANGQQPQQAQQSDQIEQQNNFQSYQQQSSQQLRFLQPEAAVKRPLRGNRRQRRNSYSQQQQHQQIMQLKLMEQTNKQVIQLNRSGTAYIKIMYLPQQLIQLGISTFSEMWNLKPQQKHKIIMFQQQYPVNRYSKSYLNTPTDLTHTKNRSYMYSGFDTSDNKGQLPKCFQPFYDFVKSIDDRYNQVIVNWYENQLDFIAPHADCQKGMIDNAQIMITSFYPNMNQSNFRYLVLTPKFNTQYLNQKTPILLSSDKIVVMCGKTQQQFLHGINRQQKAVSPRISLSFRQIKEEGSC